MAEELAQDALMRVVRDWPRVQKMDTPEAWLHRVALNLTNSFFRRRAAEARAKERLASQPETYIQPATPEHLAVREAVAALPRRQKTALVLRYFGALFVRETAQVMDCPEGTVKTLTHKAIRALRDLQQLEELREVSDGT